MNNSSCCFNPIHLVHDKVHQNNIRRIQFALRPLGAPQERVWNVFSSTSCFFSTFLFNILSNSSICSLILNSFFP
ncbi:hypothetical protein ACT453_23415, partial [Bacillus sp. D-CC]